MRWLLASVVLLASTAAQAEPGIVSGMGTQACAAINAHTQPGGGYGQNGVSAAAFSWVQGYISAWNVIGLIKGGRFADLTSLTANEQWSRIAAFCQEHPDGFLFDAARDMLANGLKMGAVIPMPPAPAGTADLDGPASAR
ncbi:MAG TPA: hypothetical protein VII40_14005 [Xanthobacteraceae bacterium]